MTTTIGYARKGEELTVIEGTDFTVLDGMLEVQAHAGQITWTKLTETVAFGLFSRDTIAVDRDQRVVVVDVDNASVQEAVNAVFWVNQ